MLTNYCSGVCNSLSADGYEINVIDILSIVTRILEACPQSDEELVDTVSDPKPVERIAIRWAIRQESHEQGLKVRRRSGYVRAIEEKLVEQVVATERGELLGMISEARKVADGVIYDFG